MLVYLSSFLLSITIAVGVKKKSLKCGMRTYSLFWVAMIPLTVVSVLRYKVGTDYTFYLENQFQFIMNLKKPDYWQVLDYEIGFKKLVEFCGFRLGDVELFFPIVAFIFMLFITFYISDLSENVVLSIFVFFTSCFFNFSFNIIRQTFATAIFLYAIRYMYRREVIKYLLCILLASTFHKTAIIYIFVYFAVNIQIKTYLRYLVIPVVYALQFSVKNFIIFLCNTFDFYKGYVDTALSETSQFPISLTLAYVGIYLLIIVFVPEEERNIRLGKIYSLLETLSIIVVLCGSIAQESTRIIYMFFPIYIVSIPYWFNRFKKTKIANFGKYCVMMLLIYIYIYYIPMNNYGDTLPYQTIFMK